MVFSYDYFQKQFSINNVQVVVLNKQLKYYNKNQFFYITLPRQKKITQSMGKKNKSLNKQENNNAKQLDQTANITKKHQSSHSIPSKNHENSQVLKSALQKSNPAKTNNNPTKQIKKDQKNSSDSNFQNRKNKKSNQSSAIQKPAVQKPQVKGKPWTELQYTLRQQIIESLKRCSFTTMLPVQQASIPLLLKNYDLAVQAQTGSGKTLSFLIPLLQKYLGLNLLVKKAETQQINQQNSKEVRPFIRYLIISPTRQLCQQTFSVLVKLIQNLPLKDRSHKYLKYCHCATGGSDMSTDIQKLKQSTIVFVGTVGRIRQLSQHMDQNWLKKVQYLYIDQADRVLKQNGIQQLIRSVQKIRRTAMFSATLQTLNQKNYDFYGMRNLAKISLKQTQSSTSNSSNPVSQQKQDKKYIIPKSLTNTYMKFNSRLQKLQFLINFLKNHIQKSKIIVFFNTCASVDYYTKLINAFFKLKQEEQIVGLHGKLKTNRRQKLISRFLKKSCGCLFATDVVSRGIDFDHIHYIVQIDPPEDPDNYVHRIGRTARINRPGTAILLIEEHQQAFINYLAQKSVGVQEIADRKHYLLQQDDAQDKESISSKMDSIMRTDRDYVQKSKKAFVSYIRSYKQHDLRYIFQFKNLDIGKTAQSFFMYRIPRIKQILGKSISSFTQSEVDIQAIPWLDKNQQLQYLQKKQKREQQQLQKKKIQRRILKNADAKNNKSRRKRIKTKLIERNQLIINKQHREFLKEKKIGGDKSYKLNEQYSEQEEGQQYLNDSDENTEQIEQRMSQKKQGSSNNQYKGNLFKGNKKGNRKNMKNRN